MLQAAQSPQFAGQTTTFVTDDKGAITYFQNNGIPTADIQNTATTLNQGYAAGTITANNYAQARDGLAAINMPNAGLLYNNSYLNVTPQIDPVTRRCRLWRGRGFRRDPDGAGGASGGRGERRRSTSRSPRWKARCRERQPSRRRKRPAPGLLSAESLTGAGKILGAAGIGFTVLDFGSTAEAAEQDAAAGNYSGAVSLYNNFAARTTLALSGATAGAIAGGAVCSASVIGIPVCAVAGGLVGGLGGSAAYKAGPTSVNQIESAFGTFLQTLASSVLSIIPTAAAPGVATVTLGSTARALTDPNAAYLLNASTGQLTSVDQAGDLCCDNAA